MIKRFMIIIDKNKIPTLYAGDICRRHISRIAIWTLCYPLWNHTMGLREFQ